VELEKPLQPIVATLVAATPTQIFSFGGVPSVDANLSIASLQPSQFDIRFTGPFLLPYNVCARGVIYVTVAGAGTITIAIAAGTTVSSDGPANTPAIALPAAGSYAVPFDLVARQGSTFITQGLTMGISATCTEAVTALSGACRCWII
jgi:hypothetical protein